MVLGYRRNLSIALIAGVADGVALSQSKVGAGALTINGSLATGGIATFDVPRRVLVTTAGNDSGITYTVTGTDRYGRVQSEVIPGPNISTAYTVKDFATVTAVTVSGSTAAAVTIGTNGVGSSDIMVLDTIANPTTIALAAIVTGSPNYTVECTYDDYAPAWDMIANSPTWFPVSGFTAQTSNQDGALNRPATAIRITNNSGVGSVVLRINQALKAGGF